MVLDESFDYNTLAMALQIPTTNFQARQQLHRELNNLMAELRIDPRASRIQSQPIGEFVTNVQS